MFLKRTTREQREEKKAKHIPLEKYTKGGRISSLMAITNIVVIILTVGISVAKRDAVSQIIRL